MSNSLFVLCLVLTLFGSIYCNCKPVDDFIECRNITSLKKHGSGRWSKVHVINDPWSTFHISDGSAEGLDEIERLDLSQAGRLDFSYNIFRDYKSLRSLNISGTGLSDISVNAFDSSTPLENLDASNNRLRSSDTFQIAEFSKLISLNLANNHFKEVILLKAGDFVRSLNLSGNNIGKINFTKPLNLTTLDLGKNLLTEIPPKAFYGLTRLNELHLQNNFITNINNDSLDGLDEMTFLNLSGNRIDNLSGTFFKRETMKLLILDLSKNELFEILENTFNDFGIGLMYLESLDLSENRIIRLESDAFFGMFNLSTLSLRDNRIQTINEQLFKDQLSLKQLDLSGNRLTVLSKSMLPNPIVDFKTLILDRNEIETLSSDLFINVKKIEFLSLSFNKLVSLPDELLAPLKNLRTLRLDHNSIKYIPSGIVDPIHAIEELFIDNNQLTFFPESNNSFPRLVRVSIEENPWQCPCLDEVLRFLTFNRISYNRLPYCDGQRPVCIVSPFKECLKSPQTLSYLAGS